MTIVILRPRKAADLKRASLTYPREAMTSGSQPEGYRLLHRTRVLPNADFAACADALLHWKVHAGAGLHVAASSLEVAVGEVVVLTLGFGRIGLPAPCRVLAVVDEPTRRGFTYGTLSGHPEAGEESFMLERRGDGSVEFTVEAISRPASLLAKVGGPFTRRIQSATTNRYLRAAGRLGMSRR